MARPLVEPPEHACQAIPLPRIVSFGHQLGTFPRPPDLVELATHRLGGSHNAILGMLAGLCRAAHH